MRFQLSRVVFFLCVHRSFQFQKMWIPDRSFENPNNWMPPKVPCSQDRVVLPYNLEFPAQILSQNVVIREVILPKDGELHLALDGVLSLGGGNPKDCPGRDIFFQKDILHSWADPSNWLTWDFYENREGGPAVTHLERLPCREDRATFPMTGAPLGMLPSVRQTVKGINMNGENLSNQDWERLEEAIPKPVDESLGVIDGKAVVIVEGGADREKGDPVCQEQVPPEMCLFIEQRCQPIKCLQPIRPFYHCCDMCGAIMTIGTLNSVESVRKMVSSFLNGEGLQLAWWVGVIGRKMEGDVTGQPTAYSATWWDSINNAYQIILVEDKYEAKSGPVAEKLKKYLQKELNMSSGSKVLMSGLPWEGENAPKGGWEALVMLLVAAGAIVAVILYYYPPTTIGRSFSPFNFARFDNRSREGSLVLGISQLSLDKAFDNPMYGTTAQTSSSALQDKSMLRLVYKKEPVEECEEDKDNDSETSAVTVLEEHTETAFEE